MKNSFKKLLVATFFLSASQASWAAEPGTDLSFLGRYPGSEMAIYQSRHYDEVNMPLGPFRKDGPAVKSQQLQGYVVYIEYRTPGDRSPLEIMSNNEETLRREGFQILWQCSDHSCNTEGGIGNVYSNSNPVWAPAGHFSTFFGNGGGRMMTARLESPNGVQTWIFLKLSGSPYGVQMGEEHVYAVQTKPMQTGMVGGSPEALSAVAMGQALQSQGRFSMHLPFDFNKTTLRPDATARIQQLADTLRQHPNWRIGLDGHTDSVGTPAYNQKLSADRAVAVKAALITSGIPASRIATRGLGATVPAASNDTEAGRAQNRRVEVVNLTPGFVPVAAGSPAMAQTPTAGSAAPRMASAPTMGSAPSMGSSQPSNPTSTGGIASNPVGREGQTVVQSAADAARGAVNYQVGQAVWGAVSGIFGH